jgi:hypothetical protein
VHIPDRQATTKAVPHGQVCWQQTAQDSLQRLSASQLLLVTPWLAVVYPILI